MFNNKNLKRDGLTLIETVIGILMASILTVGMTVVLMDSQRGWNYSYNRANEDIGIDGHVARVTFESLVRKASAKQIMVDGSGGWIQVSYYDDPVSSTELDRYSRLYVNDGSLLIEHGQLDLGATAVASTVCGNVADCVFSRNGRSAQMVLTLAEGSRQNTVVSSAYMHNK